MPPRLPNPGGFNPGYVDPQGNYHPRPAGGYGGGGGGGGGSRQSGGPPLLTPPSFQPPSTNVGPGGVARDIGQIANPGRPIPLRSAIPGARGKFVDANQGQQIVGYQLTIYDMGNGFNMQKGPVDLAHSRLASGTAYVSHEGQMILPPLDDPLATPDPTAGVTPTWMTFCDENFSQLLIGVASAGGAGSVNLFKEGTDGTFTALTYEAKILSLQRVVMNGVIYTAVGRAGAAVDLLTDYASTPTSAGSMHANTADCVGIHQVRGLGDMPLLIKRSTTLATLSNNVAIGTAPTNTISGLQTGGGVLGERGVGGREVLVYWFWPDDSASTYGNQSPLHIAYTNAFGTNLKDIVLDLKNIRGGAPIWDGFILCNDDGLSFFNGEELNLKWVYDRDRDTTRDFRCVSIYVKDGELYLERNEIYTGTGTSFTTVRAREKFDPDLWAWQPASARTTLTGTGVKTLNAFRLPVSRQTGRLVCYADGKWYSQFQPKPNQNLYNLRGGAVNFATAASATSPGLEFPSPITYVAKRPTGVHLGGDPTGGASTIATPAALKLEIVEYGSAAGTGIVFLWDSTTTNAGRYQPAPNNQTSFVFPQLLWTLTQGATTTLTPQFLPVTIDWECDLPAREMGVWTGLP